MTQTIRPGAICTTVSMQETIETVEIVGQYNAVGIDAIDVIEEMERVAPSTVTKNLPGLNLKPGAQRAVWEEAFANYARAEDVAADQVHHRRARQSTADALKDHITCALLLADRVLTPREIHAAAERYGMAITHQRLGTTLRRWLSDAPFVVQTGDDEWEIDPVGFFRVDRSAYLLAVLRSGAKFRDAGWTASHDVGSCSLTVNAVCPLWQAS
jgi:hypothetical protein